MHRGLVARFALKHRRHDIKQLIEHVLGWLGLVSLREGEETRPNRLLLEPRVSSTREAARRLRELRPDLPSVSVSTSSLLGDTPATPDYPPRRTVTVAGLHGTVESLLNPDVRDPLTYVAA